jgi:hypothetical protein
MIQFTLEQYALHQAELVRRSQPTGWQKFINKLKVNGAAPQAVSPYAANPIGIDVSHYQPKVDWVYLATYLQFAAAKCSEVLEEVDPGLWYDSTFAGHIADMDKNKIPGLAYTFANCGAWALRADYTQQGFKDLPRSQNIEYTKLVEVLRFKQYYGIIVDMERYWRYYNQYLEYLAGNRKAADIEVLSSTWIFFSVKKLIENIFEGMKAKELRMVPIFIYSAPWFVDTYMNSQGVNLFRQWATSLQGADVRIHLAAYSTPAEVTTWEDLRNHLPASKPTESQRLGMTVDPVLIQNGGGAMKLPNGQYGNNGFDLDVSTLNKADLYNWIGYGPVTPPEPNPEPPAPDEVIDVAARARIDKLEAKNTYHNL